MDIALLILNCRGDVFGKNLSPKLTYPRFKEVFELVRKMTLSFARMIVGIKQTNRARLEPGEVAWCFG